jgi:UDP-N-acetylmuramate--alanine ligase
MQHIHFIGLGGTGLSAIARVLLDLGYTVSGSDRVDSPMLLSLKSSGARVMLGHHAANIQDAELVVRSSAIPDDNPEVQAAQAAGIPVLKRGDFLKQLLSSYRVIAITGTHGKTTTTAMAAWLLSDLGLDPSFICGGVLKNLGINARAGKSQFFVIEADEYDRMFLGLHPEFIIVTNIEHDHPDCYPTLHEYEQAFAEFAAQMQPEGCLFTCAEDAAALRLAHWANKTGRKARSYGFTATAEYQARQVSVNHHGGFDSDCYWVTAGSERLLAHLSLEVPGKHNILNALAVMAVAHQLGLDLPAAAQSLGQYHGAGRRFDTRGEAGGVTIVDDYGHHPTEIRATLEAARARFPGRRLWAVWQPHTYSRTRTLLHEFASAFTQADEVVVTDIFAAREANPGFSAGEVVQQMKHPAAHFQPGLVEAADYLLANLRPGDVILVFSAGDADQISIRVLEGLMERCY